MKQMNSITPPNNNEQLYASRARKAFFAAALAMSTAACGEVAQSADNHAAATHSSGSPSASASVLQPLPPDWPDAATLPPQDCSWGAPIDHQVPLKINHSLAGVVDTRCEPPRDQPYTNVHARPTRNAPIAGRAYDFQVVRLECQIAGEPIGDERGPSDFMNLQWFRITYKNRDSANAQAAGYIAGANLGQIEVPANSPEVPLCR